MKIRALKYLTPVTVYGLTWLALTRTGIYTWLPMIYAWLLIPAVELFLKPNPGNLNAAEEEMAKKDPIYDWMLYLIVPLQYGALFYFFKTVNDEGLALWEQVGRIATMGLLCGTFGINVGHELGHRANPAEQFLAKILLLSSLYMHFFTEHNKGHHKNVATPEDPSSARKNEPVYLFYFRTIIFSYLSAWKIANDETRKKGKPVLHWSNEMLQFQIIQLVFIAVVFYFFGTTAGICFLIAAIIGALLLETVNYIEHYGLQRRKKENGLYERALPAHSWNSDHPIGRLMLFELSRHSDHHYLASRKYQILKSHDNAPQLPTGYPGSMILALLPPLWFRIMNKRISKLESQLKES